MSLFKAYVNVGGKMHTIMLPTLTMEHLKQQVVNFTQPVHTNDVSITIIDGNNCPIETDENVVNAFKIEPVYFTVQFRSEDILKMNEIEQSTIKRYDISQSLDFKKHWNMQWRKANAEAVKIVEQMICNNEKGLVIVVYNTLKWKNRNDGICSIINLIKNKNENIKEFKEYCMYIIKRKRIILEKINIDGSVYAIDCKIECKGYVNITTQIFITKNTMIDEQLKKNISLILWNKKIHYDIPIQFQDFENKIDEYITKKLYDECIIHLQTYLQIVINIFDLNHHYIAIIYNMIGTIYNYKQQYEQAIEFYKKALPIIINIFGNNCNFLAHLYENIAYNYDDAKQYDKSIEYHENTLKIKCNTFGDNHIEIAISYTNLGKIYQKKESYFKASEWYENAWKIRKKIFGYANKDNIDLLWKLEYIFSKLENDKKACEYCEELWKVRNIMLGEWDGATLRAKEKVKKLDK
ncbi:hypothetical protein RFI_22205 [Reticulomyxa filosa]|uniref:Uncharacterized protein n=2 Tax=Reticulomyxa filosa TaxID=46433 RepID=X6MMB6_RETFI|nr:hypothetical protein RFI_22205 [Reticulomyxa filosa]|eukprot:ETO15158.1 hypothetical protein RFI_22205 [Reticulomyxa filosa]